MQGFADIPKIEELWKKGLYTLLMIFVYRLGVQVPISGVDSGALMSFFQSQSGTLYGMINLFSGGALEQFSIFALGIMPYVTSSIIMQLGTVVIPQLERLSKEGEVGRRRINQYTRYGTVALCFVQGIFLALNLQNLPTPTGAPVVSDPGWTFILISTLSMTAGTALIMWLGEQITERGIGNGISLIIFAGIVSQVPSGIAQTYTQLATEELNLVVMLIVLIAMVGFIAAIIFMERSHRRLPVQYAKRVIGRKVYGGQTTYLPLRLNSAGVIPPIFASALLMLPATFQIAWLQRFLDPMSFMYNLLYGVLIIGFTYFYTAVTFNPKDVADNLKRQGGFVPGKRPGKATADYIEYVMARITLVGAIYLAAVCVVPVALISWGKVPFYFGGTSLLIVVGVVLDTVGQMESYLIARNYEGFVGAGGVRIRGRHG